MIEVMCANKIMIQKEKKKKRKKEKKEKRIKELKCKIIEY